MWAFKTLWDKGLIYEGFRVLAYCWRCETPLSNTETRMDDVYHDRQDPALTVQFELDSGERILAWTTTPWTLPSNLALAVGPDIDYAVMEQDGVRYILAESRLGAYERELGGRHAGRHAVRRRPRRPPVHSRCIRSSPTRPTRSTCWPPTTSAPRTARASCTWRPDSARRTRTSATPSASPPSARWTSTGGSRPRCRRGRACTCSTRTPTSSRTSRRAAWSCATTVTTTRTRTAGDAPSHWSTARSARGSCRSPRSAIAWSS